MNINSSETPVAAIDYPSNCGTLVGNNLNTTTSYIGDTTPAVGYNYTYPYPYTYPWAYTYTYSDPRVPVLEARVEMLEKMLAAVLSGREAPKPRRKRKSA